MDATEEARRAMLPEMPAELREAVEKGEQVWDTEALRRDFDVETFSAPFVVARRKSDGRLGSLKFTNAPRLYFSWQAHQ